MPTFDACQRRSGRPVTTFSKPSQTRKPRKRRLISAKSTCCGSARSLARRDQRAVARGGRNIVRPRGGEAGHPGPQRSAQPRAGYQQTLLQGFPEEARAETIITRDERDIKAFARAHKNNIILKPLQGSGGSGVFKLDKESAGNLNQMIDAICRDGYIICQAYIPAAKKGDIRLFLMNGRPLEIDGKYAALRRVAAKGDIRSNIHAAARPKRLKSEEPSCASPRSSGPSSSPTECSSSGSTSSATRSSR